MQISYQYPQYNQPLHYLQKEHLLMEINRNMEEPYLNLLYNCVEYPKNDQSNKQNKIKMNIIDSQISFNTTSPTH